MSYMAPHLESPVGVFWDYDSATIPADVNADMALFAGRIFEIAKSYSPLGHIDSAKMYPRGNIDGSLESKLRNVGFEVISHKAISDELLFADILFWLWDLERSRKSSKLSCVVLVTMSNDHISILNKLQTRGIYVICVSKFQENGNPVNAELKKSCSVAMDFFEIPGRAAAAMDCLGQSPLVSSAVNLESGSCMGGIRYAPSGDETEQRSAIASTLPAASLGGVNMGHPPSSGEEQWQVFASHSSSSDDYYLSTGMSLKDAQQPMVSGSSDDSNGGDTLTAEQRTLHNEFVSAVYAYNVKEAVVTLRKIYNKQTRCFRLHTVLAVVLPDTAAMIADEREDLLCVAVSFALDCIQWTLGVQKGEHAESFKYKMNVNIARWILRETVRKGVPDPPPPAIINAVVNLVDHILDYAVEPVFAWELFSSLRLPNPMQRLIPYLVNWRSSRDPVVEARLNEFLYEHQEFASVVPPSQPPHAQVMQFRPGDRGMTPLHQSFGHAARPTYFSPPGSPDDATLEGRLLRLLARSVKGELGARIPALYRDEYGEPLRLRGRKMKDILLDTGMVEMIGSEGPGDKLFRLIPRESVGGGSSVMSRAPMSQWTLGSFNPHGSTGAVSYPTPSHLHTRSGDDLSRFMSYSMPSSSAVGSLQELRCRSDEASHHDQLIRHHHQQGLTMPPARSSYARGDSCAGIYPSAKGAGRQHLGLQENIGDQSLDYGNGSYDKPSGLDFRNATDDDDNSFLYQLHDSVRPPSLLNYYCHLIFCKRSTSTSNGAVSRLALVSSRIRAICRTLDVQQELLADCVKWVAEREKYLTKQNEAITAIAENDPDGDTLATVIEIASTTTKNIDAVKSHFEKGVKNSVAMTSDLNSIAERMVGCVKEIEIICHQQRQSVFADREINTAMDQISYSAEDIDGYTKTHKPLGRVTRQSKLCFERARDDDDDDDDSEDFQPGSSLSSSRKRLSLQTRRSTVLAQEMNSAVPPTRTSPRVVRPFGSVVSGQHLDYIQNKKRPEISVTVLDSESDSDASVQSVHVSEMGNGQSLRSSRPSKREQCELEDDDELQSSDTESAHRMRRGAMGECDDGPTPPDQREGLVHEYLGQGFTAGGNSIDEPLSVQLDKQSTDSSYDNDTLTAQPQSLDEADSMIPHIGFDHMPLCGQSALDEEPLRKKLRTDSVGGVYPLDAVETKPRDNTVVERDEEGEDDWGERQQTRISTKHVSDNLTEMNSTQQIGATIFRTFKSFAADISIWRSSHTPEEPSDVIRLADKRMSGQCAPSSSAPKPISSSTLPSSLQDSNTVVDLTE